MAVKQFYVQKVTGTRLDAVVELLWDDDIEPEVEIIRYKVSKTRILSVIGNYEKCEKGAKKVKEVRASKRNERYMF